MRALGSGLITLVSIMVLTGCPAKEPFLRPEKKAESLAGAPDDSRYSKPPIFPAEAMKDLKAKQASDMDPSRQQPGGLSSPGMGTSLGGPGGGGMGQSGPSR